MSESDKNQEQLKTLPLVPTDNLDIDNNAEINIFRKEKKINTKESYKFNCRKKLQRLTFKMYLVFKELALILFIAFTYAALTNNPPKISKSPAAFPFFPKSSMITDWYRGQLRAAIDKVRESDIAFMMFYAPWDAESQSLRKEFDLAARYLQNQVAFGAINCWQPGTECQKQYTKAYNWPVLIAYVSHGNGIQYKGPRTAVYMVKFLLGLSRPMVRLTPDLQVHGLLASHDAVIAGHVDASPGSHDYAVFYTTALRFFERDPFQEVVFAVSTGQENQFSPSLTLHMSNETLVYPSDQEWETDALIMWIITHLHQISMWITPSGSKSTTLSPYMQPGPALLLFTPRNPLAPFNDFYDLLHEIGLEYHNCNDQNRNYVMRLNSLLINAKRMENYLKYTYLLKTCPAKTKTDKEKSIPSVVTYAVPKKWANHSCPLNSKPFRNSCHSCKAMDLLKENSRCERFEQGACTNLNQERIHFYDKIRKNFNDETENIEPLMINDKYDAKLPKNLQKFWKKEKCRIANIAETIFPMVVSDSIIKTSMSDDFTETNRKNISGFACKANASLSLLALDSLKYYHFAERLGIDLSAKKDRTAVVIVNDKMETHHIMEEELNDNSLREFIFNFTNNNLPRALSTQTSLKQQHTHVYKHHTGCGKKDPLELCLFELNSKTFLPTTMQQNKAVMVLYYSKTCSFCNGISYAFLTVANIFSSMNYLSFKRIDGDLHILPWQYTMDSYPTIILFPAKRKSESRSFPKTMPITVPNLISFILANLEPSLKLHAMWILCNQTDFNDEKQSCTASVRAENLSIINYTLRLWRNSNVLTKTKLLYKLQQLRNLNLLLAHLPQNVEDIQKCMARLHLATFKDKRRYINNKGFTSIQETFIKDEL